jgi:NADH:ubiquinone oxidoreductase subunit 6 (subunit J)
MLQFAADPTTPATGLPALAGLWSLWLPLLVGGAAVFCLLPRPRPYPWALGAGLGALALVLAGFFLVRVGPFAVDEVVPAVLFYLFSAVSIVSGVLLVTQHNPARAALAFALVVLSTSGLFLLLAAPFLTAATVVVYAGAIIVTFLFVLMLSQQEGASNADNRSREPLLAVVTGFVLMGALLYVLRVGQDTRAIDRLAGRVNQALGEDDPQEVKKLVAGEGKEDDLFEQSRVLLGANGQKDLQSRAEGLLLDWVYLPQPSPLGELRTPLGKLRTLLLEARGRAGTVQPPEGLPLSGLSGPPANAPSEIRRDANTGVPQLPAENSGYLGRSLFTDYLLPVELGGMLLLVATIGAIAIGQRRLKEAPSPEKIL